MRTIDVLVTSTSRPELLARTIATMQEKLKFKTGQLRWLLHEDVLDKPKSRILRHNAKYSGLFIDTVISDPRVGLGRSIEIMLPYVKSPIFFRTDDDWEYVREIDLDSLCDIFQNYEQVNQICFNKYAILGQKREFKRTSIQYNNTWLTLTRSWNWIPSLWRTQYTKDHYKTRDGISGIDLLEDIKLKPDKDISIPWLKENIGSYFLGKIGDKAKYIKHIGGGQRTLDNGGIFGI